jgi:BON domain-containing protein
MNRYNSAKVGRDYLDLIDPFPMVAAGKSQSRFSHWWSGNSREQDKNKMERRLTLENKLHCLSWILSLSLICLILISLGWAAPRSINADDSEAKPAPRKGANRDENLANVRAALEEKIRRELVTLGRVFDNVSFHLDEDDLVTLSGQVRLPSLKVSAQRAARNIEGVRGVINQLEVRPASSLDDDIRREASFQIYSYSQLSHYGLQAISPIHNIVKNGRLTLEGAVAGESDKTIACIRAN